MIMAHRRKIISCLAAPRCLLWLCLAVWPLVTRADDFQGATHMMPFDEEALHYGKTKDANPVTRLQERIASGAVRLKFDDHYGYLLSVLDALKISTNSQMLVFSKTSFQRDRISPKTPRSLFFNDDVYVGFIPGSPLLEVSTADPKLGGVFYTMEQTKIEKPKFARTDQCLECHATAKTMGVPGHLVRSFATDESGLVDLSSGISLVNHRTPLAERWGGWYVTGSHGAQTHRGNLIGKDALARHLRQPNYLGNQSSLTNFFDTSAYPEDSSDIVALMVLEHQTHMHNFLTRLNYESTLALQSYGHINYLKNIVDSFLKYLLYVEEAELTAPIHGSAAFADTFVAQGSKDKQGRSLREFDLQTRLFKYPCSYLIYSEGFDQLPEKLKTSIYQKLFDVLTGKDERPEWSGLSKDTRRAIREILVDTKRDLPACWNTDQVSGDSRKTNTP